MFALAVMGSLQSKSDDRADKANLKKQIKSYIQKNQQNLAKGSTQIIDEKGIIDLESKFETEMEKNLAEQLK